MLAVAGGKGGVGKTTTALGLAAALVARRRRPLVVDADADVPDLHAVAGVEPAAGVAALADGAPPDRVARPADRVPGADVVPARAGDDSPVDRALRRTPRDRPVVVDCPGGGGPDAVAPLRVADRTLLVATPHPPAVRDALKTAAMARAVDAPVAAVAVARADDVPTGLADAVDASAVAVPEATRPLRDDAARGAYDRLVSAVGPNG
ncbi:MAG: MinD/ParA family protein [Halobacteriaceae archaeon]